MIQRIKALTPKIVENINHTTLVAIIAKTLFPIANLIIINNQNLTYIKIPYGLHITNTSSPPMISNQPIVITILHQQLVLFYHRDIHTTTNQQTMTISTTNHHNKLHHRIQLDDALDAVSDFLNRAHNDQCEAHINNKKEQQQKNNNQKKTNTPSKVKSNHYNVTNCTVCTVMGRLCPVPLTIPAHHNSAVQFITATTKAQKSRPNHNSNKINIVSHNLNSAMVIDNDISRYHQYQRYLINTLHTAHQVDVVALQETLITQTPPPIDPRFDDDFAVFSTPCTRHSPPLPTDSRGLCIMIRKDLYPVEELAPELQHPACQVISFQKNARKCYIVNTYARHTNRARGTHRVTDVVSVMGVMMAIWARKEKGATIVAIGDYNTSSAELRTLIGTHLKLPAHQLRVFNNANAPTHIKTSKLTDNGIHVSTTTIDHAIAVVDNPHCTMQFRVLDSILTSQKQLHHKPIGLLISPEGDDVGGRKKKESTTCRKNNLRSISPPPFPQDKSSTHELLRDNTRIINMMMKNKTKRKMLDQAGKIGRDDLWHTLLNHMDNINLQHVMASTRTSTTTKLDIVNEIMHRFLSTSLGVINNVLVKQMDEKKMKATPRDEWIGPITRRYYSSFRFWTTGCGAWAQQPFAYKGLTTHDTKVIIVVLMHQLHHEYHTHWSKDQQRYLDNSLALYMQMVEQGNAYEAEKQLKMIISQNGFGHLSLLAPTTTTDLAVNHPISGTKCSTPKDVANAFADGYSLLDTQKHISTTAFFEPPSPASSTTPPASSTNTITSPSSPNTSTSPPNPIHTIPLSPLAPPFHPKSAHPTHPQQHQGLHRNLLSAFAAPFYPTSPRPGPSPVGENASNVEGNELINTPITPQEVARAVADLKAFTALGSDYIPIVFYKAVLHQRKHALDGESGEYAETYTHHAVARRAHDVNGTTGRVKKTPNAYTKRMIVKTEEFDFDDHSEPDYNPFMQTIVAMLNLVFMSGIVPSTWRISHVVPLYKKGKKDETSNYRPVSIMSNMQKILNKIITNRLQSVIMSNAERGVHLLSREQAGYSPGRERFEQILTILEYSMVYNVDREHPVYALFVDLKRAFDSCHHPSLIKAVVEKFGVQNTPLHRYLVCMYDNLFFSVKNKNVFSAVKPQRVGVRQGCTLSPLMFAVFFDPVLVAIAPTPQDWDHTTPAYADDVAAVTNNYNKMNNLVMYRLLPALKSLQLDLNVAKTKVLVINRFDDHLQGNLKNTDGVRTVGVTTPKKSDYNTSYVTADITFNSPTEPSVTVDVVAEFEYLGMSIPHNLDPTSMLSSANLKKYVAMNHPVLRNALISDLMKTSVMTKNVLPKALHNAPVLGAILLNLNEKKKSAMMHSLDADLMNALNYLTYMPQSTPTTVPVMYSVLGIQPPSVMVQLQAYRISCKLITQQHKINFWLSKYLSSMKNPYRITSEMSLCNIEAIRGLKSLSFERHINNMIITDSPIFSTMFVLSPMLKNLTLPQITVSPLPWVHPPGHPLPTSQVVQKEEKVVMKKSVLHPVVDVNKPIVGTTNVFYDQVVVDTTNNNVYTTSTMCFDASQSPPVAVQQWLRRVGIVLWGWRDAAETTHRRYPVVRTMDDLKMITGDAQLVQMVKKRPWQQQHITMMQFQLQNDIWIRQFKEANITTLRYLHSDAQNNHKYFAVSQQLLPQRNSTWSYLLHIRAQRQTGKYYVAGEREAKIKVCPLCKRAQFTPTHLVQCDWAANFLHIAQQQLVALLQRHNLLEVYNQHFTLPIRLTAVEARVRNELVLDFSNNNKFGAMNICDLTTPSVVLDMRSPTRGYTVANYNTLVHQGQRERAQRYAQKHYENTAEEWRWVFDPRVTNLYNLHDLKKQLDPHVHLLLNGDPVEWVGHMIADQKSNIFSPCSTSHPLDQILQNLFLALFLDNTLHFAPSLLTDL